MAAASGSSASDNLSGLTSSGCGSPLPTFVSVVISCDLENKPAYINYEFID